MHPQVILCSIVIRMCVPADERVKATTDVRMVRPRPIVIRLLCQSVVRDNIAIIAIDTSVNVCRQSRDSR